MDNEESSKLRDKQCYFWKWTDGYRRADPEIKNNIGSQSRGLDCGVTGELAFSYFAVYIFWQAQDIMNLQ